jgi:hypothetical protein
MNILIKKMCDTDSVRLGGFVNKKCWSSVEDKQKFKEAKLKQEHRQMMFANYKQQRAQREQHAFFNESKSPPPTEKKFFFPSDDEDDNNTNWCEDDERELERERVRLQERTDLKRKSDLAQMGSYAVFAAGLIESGAASLSFNRFKFKGFSTKVEEAIEADVFKSCMNDYIDTNGRTNLFTSPTLRFTCAIAQIAMKNNQEQNNKEEEEEKEHKKLLTVNRSQKAPPHSGFVVDPNYTPPGFMVDPNYVPPGLMVDPNYRKQRPTFSMSAEQKHQVNSFQNNMNTLNPILTGVSNQIDNKQKIDDLQKQIEKLDTQKPIPSEM